MENRLLEILRRLKSRALLPDEGEVTEMRKSLTSLLEIVSCCDETKENISSGTMFYAYRLYRTLEAIEGQQG